jgi:hypothetical protein
MILGSNPALFRTHIVSIVQAPVVWPSWLHIGQHKIPRSHMSARPIYYY